jgi:hypothetical protein
MASVGFAGVGNWIPAAIFCPFGKFDAKPSPVNKSLTR